MLVELLGSHRVNFCLGQFGHWEKGKNVCGLHRELHVLVQQLGSEQQRYTHRCSNIISHFCCINPRTWRRKLMRRFESTWRLKISSGNTIRCVWLFMLVPEIPTNNYYIIDKCLNKTSYCSITIAAVWITASLQVGIKLALPDLWFARLHTFS